MVHRQRYCLGDKLSTLRAKNIPTFTNVTMLIPYSKQACLLLVLYCFLVGQYIGTVSIVCIMQMLCSDKRWGREGGGECGSVEA